MTVVLLTMLWMWCSMCLEANFVVYERMMLMVMLEKLDNGVIDDVMDMVQ